MDGIERQFFDYLGRGVPDGPDDGTIAPWAVMTSLPFAPEFVLPTIDYYINQIRLGAQPIRESTRMSCGNRRDAEDRRLRSLRDTTLGISRGISTFLWWTAKGGAGCEN